MNTTLQFDPKSSRLAGPLGTLPIQSADLMAQRFLMLIEGQCLEKSITAIAAKYGLCRQRYYQLLEDFKQGGLRALEPEKTGPKSNYRRTDQAVRQVLRYRFLDPEASPEVVTQKLRQTGFKISQRSVQRIIADYGLQKKTPHPGPKKTASRDPHSKQRRQSAIPTRRRSQRRTGGSSAPGR